jgi:hypothetical protein
MGAEGETSKAYLQKTARHLISVKSHSTWMSGKQIFGLVVEVRMRGHPARQTWHPVRFYLLYRMDLVYRTHEMNDYDASWTVLLPCGTIVKTTCIILKGARMCIDNTAENCLSMYVTSQRTSNMNTIPCLRSCLWDTNPGFQAFRATLCIKAYYCTSDHTTGSTVHWVVN